MGGSLVWTPARGAVSMWPLARRVVEDRGRAPEWLLCTAVLPSEERPLPWSRSPGPKAPCGTGRSQVGATTTRSPTEMVPPARMSARRPPRCTNGRSTGRPA